MPTAMGSPIWEGFTPGNDARVIRSIRGEGGLVFGKTVTAEFAVHYLHYSKTVNPHNPLHIVGTSSSGSAAAIASYMVPLALGTQTAGSIIRPASYCGIFGFKPTFGTIPRTGVLKTTDSLDTIGCLARSIDDIKLLFSAIHVKGKDYPFVDEHLDSYRFAHNAKIRIGFISDGIWVFDNYEKYTLNALNGFISGISNLKNVEVVKINPHADFNRIHKIHETIYDKDLSYYFKIEFGSRPELMSEIMMGIIDRGCKISSEDYCSALDEQARIRMVINEQLKDFDVVLTLPVTGEAPLISENEKPDTCLIWTFLGYPSLNIPIFKGPKSLPFGLLANAKRYDDYKLLSVMKHLTQR
jgi:Asp-tRNA(Asn)/Glu-tRNA(Gln) amidotransferase A subunit family amidase